MKLLTIKEAAKELGLAESTLRYYEREGLLSLMRSEGGYRLFDESDMQVLRYIVVMKFAHFPISEIRLMVALFDREPSNECAAEAYQLLQNRREVIRTKISSLQQIDTLFDALFSLIGKENNNVNMKNKEDLNELVFDVYNGLK